MSNARHPEGLWVLFGTEMWERFNFYGMRTLLTLFIIHALQISEEQSSIIYGGFLGLCYLTPMLGGFIADRFLGNRYCILLGGLLMAIGQTLLFISATTFTSDLGLARTILYVALGIIIFGNGFFKPNISSMVSSLYPKAEKNKLDTAFTIFYMGINLGAFLGQLICPIIGDVTHMVNGVKVRDVFAFKWGYLAAAIAMLIGTITFYLLKDRYVVTPEGRPIGGLPKDNQSKDYEEGESQKALFSGVAIAGTVLGFIGLGLLFYFVFGQNIIYSIIYASGISLAGLILSDSSITKIERDRIWVIYIVSFFVIFFWAAFEQAGSSLTFIADKQTDLNFFGWDMPPSMVQIFNGIFVVVFAVPFSILWDKLRSKGKEPISPFKQAIGLLLIALSYFIIAHNVKDLGNIGLLAVQWLILLYMIQTFGELCLSPIGLSLVGKLAPKRFSSLLYGVFFLSNASGYALAGTLGSILPPTSKEYIAAGTSEYKETHPSDSTAIIPTVGKIQIKTDGNFSLFTVPEYRGSLQPIDFVVNKGNNGLDTFTLKIAIHKVASTKESPSSNFQIFKGKQRLDSADLQVSESPTYTLSGQLLTRTKSNTDTAKQADSSTVASFTTIGIDLKPILDGEKEASGAQLFALAKSKVGTIVNDTIFQKEIKLSHFLKDTSLKLNEEQYALIKEKKLVDYENQQGLSGKELIELVKNKKAKLKEDAVMTPEMKLSDYLASDTSKLNDQQIEAIKEKKLYQVKYPVFAGFTIHNLFEFFMVFVVLCGIASVLLFGLTPKLKGMMHGVN